LSAACWSAWPHYEKTNAEKISRIEAAPER